MFKYPPVFLLALILIGSAAIAANADRATDGFEKRRTDLSPQDIKRVTAVTAPATDFSRSEVYEGMPGGASTSRAAADDDAFSHPSANIPFEERQDFNLGKALFKKLWVSAPSSTQASDGLGPLFNARSCMSCHVNDGRGRPADGVEPQNSMLMRLARPPESSEEQRKLAAHEVLNFPDTVYGHQLQELAVPGLATEGKVSIHYVEKAVMLPDGESVSLRQPIYTLHGMAYGPLGPTTTISPRIAPPMIGLGLIEAISDADLLAHADPDDQNGDGIRGKVALVRDHRTGKLAIGRFGWKAQNADIRDQSADAFSADIGISTPDRPDPYGDCTVAESRCLTMPTGVQKRLGDVEAPDPVLKLVTFYSANLAVPARSGTNRPDILAGKKTFYESGCAACHVPKYVTRRDAANPASAFQLIWPYSDFLLHDMGSALADGQEVGVASGSEWRTPPLWGIGLTQTVNGHRFFLHDGRARNLTEAILWHGGEAEKARSAFAALPKDQRQALITFLESL
ncbi:di-heme oxidoreductase family protein [Oryzifoliimicrobium ureilyticus]|uniref:di-heme oxidoreductase family protein n=1 Tax=Oryzifoliimicrobium ureilyticus TaxID=3113724 RepID=UPI00307636E9